MGIAHLRHRARFFVLGFVLVIAFGLVGTALAAASGSATLTSPQDITGSGTASVQLQVSAQSVTVATPTDVVFVMDQSGSIDSSEFAQMGTFASNVATSLVNAGLLTNGGRIAVVPFATQATVLVPLTNNLGAINNALTVRHYPGGATYLGAAMTLANQQLGVQPAGHARVMLIMTDGVATDSTAIPVSQANALQIERFAVGIGNGIDLNELNSVSSPPPGSHVFTAADFGSLQSILESLVAAVTQPGATNVSVTAAVASRFGPATNVSADLGSVSVSGQDVTWTIPALGTADNPDQTATLTYDIAVSCDQGPGGTLPLHDAITYHDDQGTAVSFDLLSVNLHGCPAAIDLQPASQQATLGTTQTVTATVTDDFGDPIANAPVQFDVTAGPDAGATGTANTDASGQATFDVTGAATGTDTVSASTGSLTSPDATIEWVNQPPVAIANGPYQVDEGSSVTLDSAGSLDPDGQALTIAWDLDNNGTYETPGATAAFAAADGPATATVGLQVCDPFGACDQTAATVNIANVAPTPDAGAAQTVYRNDVVQLTGTWTDPAGALDAPYAWTWDLNGDGVSDASGNASVGDTVAPTASFATAGTYTLTFTVTDKDGGAGTATVVITVLDRAPVCDAAAPSIATLWSPNGKLVSVTILGVSDPEGDPVTIRITSITQDEPVVEPGDHHVAPDGFGIGTDTAQVRAERAGTGNGRVYHIGFTADDGHGGTCTGSVSVSVPHDQSGPPAIDDGANYDSTVS